MQYMKTFTVLAIMIGLTACNAPEKNVQTDTTASTSEISSEDNRNSDEDNVMTTEGYFMPCTNGSYLIVSETVGEVVLYPENDDKSIFDDLTAGDKIKAVHGLIEETYPGRTAVYDIEKLSDGNFEDIPAEKISHLEEMGWTAVADPAIEDYELIEIKPQCTPSMGFSFKLPEDWTYEGVQTDDEPTSSSAVYLKPSDVTSEGTIVVEYIEGGVGVCGTGLTEREIDFNGYPAVQGFYNGSDIWSYIILKEDYNGCAIWNNTDWYGDYAEEADFILSTVEFKHYE